jgi:hypothetical protein
MLAPPYLATDAELEQIVDLIALTADQVLSR